MEVSTTRTSGFSIIATLSRLAASGRHSTARSQELSISRRFSVSLRASPSRTVTSRSARPSSRERIRSPAVPALPSINTLVIYNTP